MNSEFKTALHTVNLPLITFAKPKSKESRARMVRNCTISAALHVTMVQHQTLAINSDCVSGRVEINGITWCCCWLQNEREECAGEKWERK